MHRGQDGLGLEVLAVDDLHRRERAAQGGAEDGAQAARRSGEQQDAAAVPWRKSSSFLASQEPHARAHLGDGAFAVRAEPPEA